MQFTWKSIQFKITVAIMTTSILLLIILGVFSINQSRQLLMQESEKNIEWMVESYANEFSIDLELIEKGVGQLNDYVTDTIDYSQLKSNKDYLSLYEKEIEAYFFKFAKDQTESFSAYVYFDPKWSDSPHDIYFVDGNSDRVPDRQEHIPFSYYNGEAEVDDDKFWWYGPISKGQGVWTNPYEWTLINDEVIKVVSYVEPVYVDGDFIGVVGSYYKFDAMFETISNLKIYNTGYAALFNEKMDIIVHPDYASGTRNNSYSYFTIEDGIFETVASEMMQNDRGVLQTPNVLAYSTLSNGWKISVNPVLSEVYSPVNELIVWFIMVLIAGLIIAVGISILLGKNISQSLLYLRNAMIEVNKGNYNNRILNFSNDEIGDISKIFNDMCERIYSSEIELKDLNYDLENKVEQRTKNLEQRNYEIQRVNNELGKTLAELQETQTKLIQSEKTSSISRLVNGIAHEINTPVGNAITMISFLINELDQLIENIDDGALDLHSLHISLKEINDANNAILVNLKNAGKLISDFKLISVKSQSFRYRSFELKELVDDVFKIAKFKYNESFERIKVLINISDTLTVSSYPSIFEQILEGLLSNVIHHAYGEGETGKIIVTCEESSSKFIMTFEDDGKGISNEIVDEIFEPFFTTDQDQSALGLGLFTAQNLVTNMLEGQIYCETEEGVGTKIIMEFPKKILKFDS